MTIVLCASLSFYDTCLSIKSLLEKQGHEVLWPWGMQRRFDGIQHDKSVSHSSAIRKHYKKIQRSDAILVVNEKKNGIAGYIGGNTLMEMGFAFVLKKKIYLLNPIPDISYKEEIIAMKPVVLEGEIDL